MISDFCPPKSRNFLGENNGDVEKEKRESESPIDFFKYEKKKFKPCPPIENNLQKA